MGETGLSRHTRFRREWITWPNLFAMGAGLVVLIAAFAGAWLERNAIGQLPPGESLASAAAGLLDRVGTGLPFGYAFAAGMVAAVNPCGFALLPAYVGLYLGSGDATRGLGALPKALRISATVTI